VLGGELKSPQMITGHSLMLLLLLLLKLVLDDDDVDIVVADDVDRANWSSSLTASDACRRTIGTQRQPRCHNLCRLFTT